MLRSAAVAVFLCSALAIGFSQTDQDSQSSNQGSTQDQQQSLSEQNKIQITPMSQTPVYRVNVRERTTEAVDYRHRAGSTSVEMKGTELQPQITGKAKVNSKAGRLEVGTELEHMKPAGTFGPQYLTYVLWAITPAGRPVNLGEVLPNDDGNAKLNVTTQLQAFGLIVTAEPYFAVTRPSDMVVAENIYKHETKGWEQPITAKFEALNRGEYTVDVPASQLPATTADRKKVPLELLEARNAVAIAKASGADRYAADTLQRAEEFLARGEDYLRRKQSKSAIGTVARYAAQQAEDARLLTIRRRQQEEADNRRKQLEEQAQKAREQAQQDAARAEAARKQAEQAAEGRAQAEQQRQEALQQQQAAEQARLQAQQQAQLAAQERAAAEQARQQALAAQQQLQVQVQQERLRAQQAEQEKEQARARLTQQLNQVLQTRDTARGLIVNMSDVLFDFNKASLKPGARERLARVAGIILAYPDLKLQIEGFTDNVGSESYNEELSQKRAQAVRDFLVSQGVNMNNVSAHGMGESNPVASNSTAEGRQMNRRVELIVSGQSIEAQGRNTMPGGTPGTTATGTTGSSSTTETTTTGTVESTSPAQNRQQPAQTQPGTETQPASTIQQNEPTPAAPSGQPSQPAVTQPQPQSQPIPSTTPTTPNSGTIPPQ